MLGCNPMSSSDHELDREVDDLLSQLPSKPYQRPSIVSGSGQAAALTGHRRPAPLSTPKVNVGRARGMSSDVPDYAWAKAVLAWALLVALPFWPYGNACGGGLFSYVGVVVIMLLTSGWAAVAAWRERNWRAYLVVMVVAAAGIVMVMQVTLPRTGYAAATAGWGCSAPAVTPAASPAVNSGVGVLPRFM